MPFGRKSPLEALALPGVILAYKYSQFRQRRREAASRRVTERELAALHHKIDKLLNKLEESEPDPPTSQEDECVICINARATMQTSPCGHRVVCRRCFVKTIQSAVAQRMLPLRCVICRARVNRLTSSSGTWRIQESASTYSMGAKSWASVGGSGAAMPSSSSTYSGFHSAPAPSRYPRHSNGGFAQSASLYSMSSTGSSTMSGLSHVSAFSKTSSISSGLCSPASPISPSSASSSYSHASILNNHLAPPTPSISPSCSGTSSGSSLSPHDQRRANPQLNFHSHHAGCPSGCSGAVPRKPLHAINDSSSSSYSSASCATSGNIGSGTGTLPNPTHPPHLSHLSHLPHLPHLPHPHTATQTYSGRRLGKGRLVDLQNRLPPIKEFRSPAKVPHPSPVHVSNPKFRYASYTKSNSTEMAPLLKEPSSPPRRPMNIQVTTSLSTLPPAPHKTGGAKISPIVAKNALPKNAFVASKDKRPGSAQGSKAANSHATTNANNNTKSSHTGSSGGGGGGGVTTTAGKASSQKGLHDVSVNTAPSKATTASTKTLSQYTSSSSRTFQLFSSSNHKEKADNKKNETMERKKKEEKLKIKAEKEARKEEKRLAKEEERIAKVIAKEEKKKVKKEAKELLLANDGNNKK